jgi:thioredoxin reductase (NADPH)
MTSSAQGSNPGVSGVASKPTSAGLALRDELADPASSPARKEIVSTANGARPLIVVLHDHPDDLARLLNHRFGSDYRVVAARCGADVTALARDNVVPGVALVIADRVVAGEHTTHLLASVRTTNPAVVRCILVPVADRVLARGVHTAVAAGYADRTLPSPWGHPEVELYPAVSSMLGQWWRTTAPEQASAVQLTIVAKPSHPRLAELRDLADRNGVATRFVWPGDADGQRLLADVGAGPDSVVVAAADRPALVDPTLSQIGALVGARTVPPSDHCDLLIIGGGPSGLAAAIYGASEGLATVLLEKRAIGGQAGTSSSIRNYPGFPYGVSGSELATLMVQQAWMLGAESVYRAAVALQVGEPDHHRVVLEGGAEITARAIVLATGVQHRLLRAPGVERLLGAGVYHGAARAEARHYTGKDVFVVGGGNSAGQAAIHLAQYARNVTIMIRGESLAASTSDYLLREIDRTHNIAIGRRSEIVEAHGIGRLEALSIRTGGRTSREHADAVFIMIGADPDTAWLPRAIERDDYGYLLTGADTSPSGSQHALTYESTVEGIFAIGDVRHGSTKRVATGVGEGAVCIVSVHAHLARAKSRLAISRQPVQQAASG